MNEPLTDIEKCEISGLIIEFPDDGTDWDGVSPDTCRFLLRLYKKAKSYDDFKELAVFQVKHLKEKIEEVKEFSNNTIASVTRTLQHPSWILDEGELRGQNRVATEILKILEEE